MIIRKNMKMTEQTKIRLAAMGVVSMLAFGFMLVASGTLNMGASNGMLASLGNKFAVSQTPEEEVIVESAPLERLGPEVVERTVPFVQLSPKTLRARSVYVYSVDKDEVVYAYDAGRVMPLASLTKVVTALLAHKTLEEDDEVEITEEDLYAYGDIGLLPGEAWNNRELIDIMLLSSSNDAAQALARSAGERFAKSEGQTESLFVPKMNELVETIGLETTYFTNPTGLDDEENSGSFGTAKDVAKLFAYAHENMPELLGSTGEERVVFTNESGTSLGLQNTNQVVGALSGIIASKTGYTEDAGGNLAIITESKETGTIVSVVLGSTYEERFSDLEKIHTAINDAFASEEVDQSGFE